MEPAKPKPSMEVLKSVMQIQIVFVSSHSTVDTIGELVIPRKNRMLQSILASLRQAPERPGSSGAQQSPSGRVALWHLAVIAVAVVCGGLFLKKGAYVRESRSTLCDMKAGPSLHLRFEPPPLPVLVDLVIVTAASMAFGGAMGLITFVLHRLRPSAPHTVTTIVAALAAVAAFFPFWLNGQVRTHFMVFFSTASHGVLIFFKTVEVLCQTTPAGLERSLKPWMVYFACDAEMKFARPAPAGDTGGGASKAVAHSQAKAKLVQSGPLPSPPLLRVLPRLCFRMILFMGIHSTLLHVGAVFDWRPFRPRLGFVGGVLDVYFWSFLLWTCAEWVIALARIAVHACGYDTIPAFRLPLLRSTSPREFWGKRWNLIIHKLMHRTYFTPVTGRLHTVPPVLLLL